MVGLAGFGGTTLLLQFHNLNLCEVGPVFWCALFFGGLAQLVAGFLEFRTGNNFGFAAFCTYGAFWLALGGIFLGNKVFNIDSTDVGWFLVIFTILTAIFLIGALKQNGALSFLFLTLLIGFVLLDICHLVDVSPVVKKMAAVDLIFCALTAWYIMAHVIFAGVRIALPLGKAWIAEPTERK